MSVFTRQSAYLNILETLQDKVIVFNVLYTDPPYSFNNYSRTVFAQ